MSGAVAVAATETTSATGAGKTFGLITLAALALPGVMPAAARADEAPERGRVAFKYLSYQDSQSVKTRYPFYEGNEGSSFDRVHVSSPSMQLTAPLGRRWSVDASGVVDSVSGASPRYYSDVSGASQMSDRRTAADLKVTRYFDHGAVGLGVAHSGERDYKSNAVSLDSRWSGDDNNTTAIFGLGLTRDAIDPVGGGAHDISNEHRRTFEFIVGMTRAATANDLLQLTLTYSSGRGYFSDPYKLFDERPRERVSAVGLLRWNHHLENAGATLRSSYRLYSDSFGIRAHTLDLAWVQPITDTLKLTPSGRYYSQSSATFYYDPVTDLDLYPGPVGNPTYSSTDQRLSAFGDITLGLKAELSVGVWSGDVKFERYEQRSRWRMGGKGSPGIDPFHANFVQLGLSRSF